MHVKDIFLATVDQPEPRPVIWIKDCLAVDIRRQEAASWQEALKNEWVKEMQQKARLAAANQRPQTEYERARGIQAGPKTPWWRFW